MNRGLAPSLGPALERARLAAALFGFLERRGLRWCVVGDTRALPDAVTSDLDLVVDREGLAACTRLLGEFCRAEDLRLVQRVRHERCALYFVAAWTSATGRPAFIAVDFCSDFVRRGRRFLNAEELLAGCRPAREGGFPVPAAPMQFIYYLLKRIDKADLDADHGAFLSARWLENPAGAARQLGRFWRELGARDAIARAAGSGDWSQVRGALPVLRRELRRAVPRGLRGWTGELTRGVERIARPTGLVIAVLGPDGSGKSSLLERVLADLAPAFRRTRYLHLRPRLLGGRGSAEPVVAPHGTPARGAWASAAKLAYLVADHLLGYLVTVRPAACRTTLVAFDRHFIDLLADPLRHRYGGPPRLARWAALAVPEPDLWLLVEAPAEVVQARKCEVSPEESERQRARYRALVAGLPNAATVDGTRAPDEVANEAADAVLRFLEGRLAFRHRAAQLAPNPLAARVLQCFARRRTPLLARLAGVALGSDVFCRIVAPIHMPHPYGIVIHSQTQIGANVTVMQGVTLGAQRAHVNVAPVVEDGAYIGAGAKVLGSVRIGAGAIVGANAVVTRDVPPRATVVGANRILPRADESIAG